MKQVDRTDPRRFVPGWLRAAGLLFVAFAISFFAFERLPHFAAENEAISVQKISDTVGGFSETLDNSDLFGTSIAELGDWDGDGVTDVVIGASGDDDGGTGRGAIYMTFLNRDGTVKSETKISDTVGGFSGVLANSDAFGTSIDVIGDLDNDGVDDLIVGAPNTSDGGGARGAVWVLFMDSDGTVSSEQKISDTAGSFTGVLDNSDFFGQGVAGVGDLDGDGIEDVVVGANGDDDGGTNRGAAWVLFLDTDGTVQSHQKISDTDGSFDGVLVNGDQWGFALDDVRDMNGDGIRDLAIGEPFDADGGSIAGAVWVLFMDTNGTVKSEQKISGTTGGMSGEIPVFSFFGAGIADVGDVNFDKITDLAVGGTIYSTGTGFRGGVWLLIMNNDGTVADFELYADATGGFTETLDDFDFLGSAIAAVGDLDADKRKDIMVGAQSDDDGGTDRGAVYTLFLDQELPEAPGPTIPTNMSLMINNDMSCSPTRLVTLEIDGDDVHQVVVGSNEEFTDGFWEPFTEKPMTRDWLLPDEDGEHTVYLLARSLTFNHSEVISKTITLDRATACEQPVEEDESGSEEEIVEEISEEDLPEVPEVIAPACDVTCHYFSHKLTIENPDGTRRTFGDDFVRAELQENGRTLYRFEDKGDDNDFRDVEILVDDTSCDLWAFELVSVDSSFQHTVSVELFHGGNSVGHVPLFSNSQSSIGSVVFVDPVNVLDLCPNEEVLAGVTLYEHPDFTGRSETFFAGSADPDFGNNLLGHDWASSIRVFGGAVAHVYQHINYDGEVDVFMADDANLMDNFIGSDVISAIRVFSSAEESQMDDVPLVPKEPMESACALDVPVTIYMQFDVVDLDVRRLQALMKCLGYFPDDQPTTAIYGPITEEAVRTFQVDHGLPALGVVGPATREIINSYVK